MTSPTPFCETLEKGRNNFDLIRLCAAIAVICGHSFGHVRDPISRLCLGLEYSASLAVYAFFLLSGMLITASYERQNSAGRFILLRVARIYPALWAFIAVAIIVTGLFFLSPASSLSGLLSDRQTLDFILRNMIIVTGVRYDLPGTLEASYIPHVVNAPWWTLPLELYCYIVVLGLGLSGLLRKPATAAGAAVFLFLLFLIGTHFKPHWKIFYLVEGYSFYPIPFFLLGIVLCKLRHLAPRFDGRAALALGLFYPLIRQTWIGPACFYAAFVYILLWLATTEKLRRFNPRHDYSYGIYIYGFFCQQIISSIVPHSFIGSYVMIATAVPAALLCGALSWHLIEAPALRLCRRVLRGESESIATAPCRQNP